MMEQKYSISEIADILGISKEMIRYYEKRDIIVPKRADNNYRYYSGEDFFVLCEMLQLKTWQISLKDIVELKSNDTVDLIIRHYSETLEALTKELTVSMIRKKRLENLIDQLETCKLNIGNYWIEKSKSGLWYAMMEAEGDTVGALKSYGTPETSAYRAENIALMDCMCIRRGTYSEWGLFLNEEYFPAVTVPVEEASYAIGGEMCFCTVINMGELGSYNEEILDPIITEMKSRGFLQAGDPRGVILIRGMEDGKYCRFLKILIPVKKVKTISGG